MQLAFRAIAGRAVEHVLEDRGAELVDTRRAVDHPAAIDIDVVFLTHPQRGIRRDARIACSPTTRCAAGIISSRVGAHTESRQTWANAFDEHESILHALEIGEVLMAQAAMRTRLYVSQRRWLEQEAKLTLAGRP